MFAEVWEEGSVIQIATVPVTNEKPLDTVAHCSACLEGKILPGQGRNLSKSMMKLYFIDIINKDVFMGNKLRALLTLTGL